MHVLKLRLATIALSLFSPLAVQAVEFIDRDFPLLSYGQSFVLSWNHPNGLTSIALATGPASDLVPYLQITPAGGVEGTSYIWHSIPSSIPAGQYAFTITSGGESNYSPFFCIEACPTASSTTPLASTSAIATSTTVMASSSSSSTTAGTTTTAPYQVGSGNGTSGYVAVVTGSGSGSTGQAGVVTFTGGARKVGSFALGAIAAGALGAVIMVM